MAKIMDDIMEGVKKVNTVNQKLLEDETDLGMFFSFGISVSVDEAVKNAIEHGNKNDINKKVYLYYEIDNEKLLIKVKDEGEGFDYKNLKPGEPDDEKGRGLLLIKNFMDKILFNEKGNEITMIKYRKA
jgi:serine/threonine-protein kinase RsbW